MASHIIFTVKDDNPIGATLIGRAYVPVKEVLDDRNWGLGIRSPKFPGVPYTFCSQRQGCWSVYTEITLVRDSMRPKPGGDTTLGELLKKKAKDGVRVLMLVWDDRTSIPLIKKHGYMGTHDEETEGTIEIATMFTHHQKIVVVDSELPSGGTDKRRIVSFVGGIDLCDGRYDTPFHSLFRTLDTAHHDDFPQINFPGASIKKGGPREPWHDIHSPLEGPVAWDVCITLSRDGGSKLFRSIDGGAAYGFPETPEDAAKAGLVSGKDNIIDRSIQDAYINAIRRAKNFIYIENQYFLGSCYDWSPDGIKPEDIEGEPEGGSVQAILDWQRRTMDMMYKDVVQALNAKGIDDDPRNYLTFFCLGNREVKKQGEYEPSERPEPDSDYMRAQEARRFMIYVHAKMMIETLRLPWVLISPIIWLPGSLQGVRSMVSECHCGMSTLACFMTPSSTQKVKSVLGRPPARYPVGISSEGKVTELPGFEFFPDTKASVHGHKDDYLPPILTT
ncbi:Phospholipase D/Transphosphatidylase [Sesbania bispinosa]|nr:Phospholipase D/Transphosphatidylase [Sesbania bispinosa]